MRLGRLLATLPDEVEADFRQYYQSDIDPGDIRGVGEAIGLRHAAALASQLPDDSRVARAEGDGWSQSERLLWSCEFSSRVLRWQPTPNGTKGLKQPTPLETPNEVRRRAEAANEYSKYDRDLTAELLGIPEDRR